MQLFIRKLDFWGPFSDKFRNPFSEVASGQMSSKENTPTLMTRINNNEALRALLVRPRKQILKYNFDIYQGLLQVICLCNYLNAISTECTWTVSSKATRKNDSNQTRTPAFYLFVGYACRPTLWSWCFLLTEECSSHIEHWWLLEAHC